MARKSLRPQLNQIRAWVRQGRTDAWIAHQLEVTTAQLREFRRQHDLAPGDEDEPGADLRDQIEAEIEAAQTEAEESEAEEEPADVDEGEGKADRDDTDGDDAEASDGDGERPRRRRRRRRGRRGRGRRALEATFDHGEKDGYGLWLDPAVVDDPIYAEHWAGQRALRVTIEAERIVLERVENAEPASKKDEAPPQDEAPEADDLDDGE